MDLNQAVERYYDSTIDLYEGLWGEHVHHGYWDIGESPAASGPDRHAASDRTVGELAAFAGIPAGSYVLDAGCGIGGPALYLARRLGCRVEGITLSSQQVVRAEQRAREAGLSDQVSFRQMDAVQTDYPEGTFDAVWALESLEHIPDRAAFLAEALRVLRPGGVLAVSTWCTRDGQLDNAAEDLLSKIYKRQAIPGLPPFGFYDQSCRAVGYQEVRVADWTAFVRNTWDTDFSSVDDQDATFLRDVAREKGHDVLRFFYAIPLMKRAYDEGVMHYAAVAARKP